MPPPALPCRATVARCRSAVDTWVRVRASARVRVRVRVRVVRVRVRATGPWSHQ